jgi:hypothetical protein
MRYLVLLSLLLLSGCYYGPYGYGYGYGYGYPYRPYPPSYYTSAPPPYAGGQQQQQYYGDGQPGYGNPAANDPNNCGTPDQPRSCYR